MKHILINLDIRIDNQSTEQKTITERKSKNRPISAEIGLFVLVWLPGRDSQQNSFGYHFGFLMTPIKKNIPTISYSISRE